MTPIPKEALPIVEYIRENVERPPAPKDLLFVGPREGLKNYIKSYSPKGSGEYKELLKFISRLSSRPEKIIVNHGEKSKSLDFARYVKNKLKIDAIVPTNLDSIRLK